MCFMDNVNVAAAANTNGAAEKLMSIVSGGAATLMLSIGHRTGLFDCLADLKPATSAAIATAAGLNERYVREWLGAMVAAGIVDYDPTDRTYHLSDEYAALLTRKAEANLAAFAQFIPVLGSVEDKILNCFERGGGLRYEDYPRFHEVMAEESQQTVVAGLLDHVVPLVPDLQAKLTAGIDVLDIGCGRGHALLTLAEAFPSSNFVGYDLCPDAITYADAAANGRGLENVHFATLDVAQLHDRARFDLITAFDAIHDQAAPDVVLANIHKALKPDGVFLMQDIMGTSDVGEDRAHPLATVLYTISCLHCMSVSLGQNGMGLGAMWGRKQAEQMLAAAGFSQVDVRTLDHDIQNFWYIAQP